MVGGGAFAKRAGVETAGMGEWEGAGGGIGVGKGFCRAGGFVSMGAMRRVRLEAPGKINLMLAVTGPRADGYHELVSVAAPLELADGLEAAGIPYAYRGEDSVFETPEAEEMQWLLAALCDSAETGLVRAALASDFCGVDAGELARSEQEPSDEIPGMEAIVRAGRRLRERGIAAALGELEAAFGARERALAGPGCERRLTNRDHLTELLHEAEMRESLSPHGLLRWLERSGFNDAQVVNVTVTMPNEQRRTAWMPFFSLNEALAPDHAATIEGHPPPTRAILIAHRGS